MFSRMASCAVLPWINQGAQGEAVLDLVGLRRQHVDMIVSVISDRVAVRCDSLEPIDVFLLEDPADDKRVHHAAMRFTRRQNVDRVGLGRVVQVALFVIPVRVFPVGKVTRHLQVERDGDQCLLGRRGCLASFSDQLRSARPTALPQRTPRRPETRVEIGPCNKRT